MKTIREEKKGKPIATWISEIERAMPNVIWTRKQKGLETRIHVLGIYKLDFNTFLCMDVRVTNIQTFSRTYTAVVFEG